MKKSQNKGKLSLEYVHYKGHIIGTILSFISFLFLSLQLCAVTSFCITSFPNIALRGSVIDLAD